MVRLSVPVAALVVVVLILGNASVVSGDVPVVCGLDEKINVETFSDYVDEIGNIFGSACGRNRGIFVTEPADGHTYNCAHFPVSWGVEDANAIKKAEPATAVRILNEFISSVYLSTPDYIRAKDPGACDFEAMSSLTCGKELPWRTAPWYNKLLAPIRAVNIGGLFILSRWMLPGFVAWGEETGIVDNDSFSHHCAELALCGKLETHWETFYEQADFDQMRSFGLNSVRIPVGFWYFERLTGREPTFYIKPTKDILDENHPLTNTIRMAKNAGLFVILDLEAVTTEAAFDAAGTTIATAAAMATYIAHIEAKFGLDNIILLEIGSAAVTSGESDAATLNAAITSVHSIIPTLPTMVLDSSATPSAGLNNVYLNMKVFHGYAVPDVASDTSAADREKMYAHEKIACGFKAPLHFSTCQRLPTFVGEFSLATENCLPNVDTKFKNYGQCDRIGERKDSPWWQRHTKSFAMRQIDTYERELGWAFWSFKLDAVAEAASPSAVYWSFRMAVMQGLIDVASKSNPYAPVPDACLHSPIPDYILGDDTYAPTPVPSWWVPPQPDTPTRQDVPPNGSLEPVDPSFKPLSARVNSTLLLIIIVIALALGGLVYFLFCRNGSGSIGYASIPANEQRKRELPMTRTNHPPVDQNA